MVAGLFLSSLSFVIAALVQIELQESGYIKIHSGSQTIEVSSLNCVSKSSISYQFTTQKSYRFYLAANGKSAIHCMTEDVREKPAEGQSYLSIFSNINKSPLKLKLVANGYSIKSNTGINFNLHYNDATNFSSVEPGGYDIYYKEANSSHWTAIKQDLVIGFGAVYTLLIFKANSTISSKLFTSVVENSLSMLWLVPQYVVITVGEILFSITGLSLAYSQAPKSMKTVVQAAWLMTSAVGDLIVVIVAEGRFIPSQVGEFFFFAGLMAVDSFIFMSMTYFYKYQDYSSVIESESSDFEDTTRLINHSRENEHITLQEISNENHLRNRT